MPPVAPSPSWMRKTGLHERPQSRDTTSPLLLGERVRVRGAAVRVRNGSTLTPALYLQGRGGRRTGPAGRRAIAAVRTAPGRVARGALRVALLLAGATAAAWSASAAEVVSVTIDPSRRYQTIRGWSATPWYLGVSPLLRDQVLDEAVGELGITRLRYGQPSGNHHVGRAWEWDNDDTDPTTVRWSAVNTALVDRYVRTWLEPLKRRVVDRGERFELWLGPSFFKGGASGAVPAWLVNSPAEAAEYAVSAILYLKNAHGLETDHYVICNEPGYRNPFSPEVMREMVEVVGGRFEELGLPTRIQFPDSGPARGLRYIAALEDRPRAWRRIEVLSYHISGRLDPFRERIARAAGRRGLVTAQSEYRGVSIDQLYYDLAVGNVSYWSVYGLAGPYPGERIFRLHLDNTSFSRGRMFWTFRQVMHYVRPGAVRISARSSHPGLRTLAFLRDGRAVVVLINRKPLPPVSQVLVRGLPEGRYCISRSVHGRPVEELGVRLVGSAGELKVALRIDSVLTIYPHPGGNLPPVVTDWRAKPTWLEVPADRAVLWAAAVDPEGDPLTFTWRLKAAPVGANVLLTSPRSPLSLARGLSRPGEYVFELSVSDAHHTVRRRVHLRVFADNQPPTVLDVHNRMPVRVSADAGRTQLRGSALDLEGDSLAFRWRLVESPPGTAVSLAAPDSPRCEVKGMTVPGRYLFRLEVSDGNRTASQELAVPVYPADRAPIIRWVRAVPAHLPAPSERVELLAATGDPDGDAIAHWWRIERKPEGAAPVISRPFAPHTAVTGLDAPGRYVFSLTVADRKEAVSREVAVTVGEEGRASSP